MSHNRKTLLTLAAERRVVGHSWESIARELQRKPKTCQNWPAKYRSEWEPIYRDIQQRRFEQTSNECHTRLIALTRHPDPKVQHKAIELWVKSCAATYGRNGSMTLPETAVSAPTHNQKLMAGVLEDMEYTRNRMNTQRAMKGLPPIGDAEFFEEWERELDAVAKACCLTPSPPASGGEGRGEGEEGLTGPNAPNSVGERKPPHPGPLPRSGGEGESKNGVVLVGLLLAALVVQRPSAGEPVAQAKVHSPLLALQAPRGRAGGEELSLRTSAISNDTNYRPLTMVCEELTVTNTGRSPRDRWTGLQPAAEVTATSSFPERTTTRSRCPLDSGVRVEDTDADSTLRDPTMLRTALVALLTLPVLGLAADRPPNVVIIYADDLGYGDVGCFGNKNIRTPHIDSLAKDGVRFTDFCVAQAVCSASRAALLTGCYPNRIGILGALGPASKNGIHDNETTIAEVLKTKGYATAIYGKWHLGHHPQFLPTKHGFDDYFGLPYSNDMWPQHPTAKFPDLPLIEGDKVEELNPDQTQLVTWYTERATKFIETNKAKPFFLYVPHAMPHVPLFVSDKHKGKSKAGTFGDVIEEIDWSVGQILGALEKHGLESNTLVIFTSDNGPWLSYGNHAGSAGPLREGKGTSFEGGVRVPFVARYPDRIHAGTVCSIPAMTIDLLPTIARFANAELPKLPIDGKDITALMTGRKGAQSPHEVYAFYWGQELQALRAGKWKVHFPHEYRTLKEAGKDGKPGPYANARTELALFDLEADPGEKTDLSAAQPAVLTRLGVLAERIRTDLGDVATKREGKGVRPAGVVHAQK